MYACMCVCMPLFIWKMCTFGIFVRILVCAENSWTKFSYTRIRTNMFEASKQRTHIHMYTSMNVCMYVCILHTIQSCADTAVVWLSAYQNVHKHTTKFWKQPKRCHFLCTIPCAESSRSLGRIYIMLYIAVYICTYVYVYIGKSL